MAIIKCPHQRAIAKELGLTQETALMALHNVRSIPESTCKLVQKNAKEIGYQPSLQVSHPWSGYAVDVSWYITVAFESLWMWPPKKSGVETDSKFFASFFTWI
jgi:hypothetical protein